MRVMHVRALIPAVGLVALSITGCSGHGLASQGIGGSNGYISGDLALKYIAVSQRHTPTDVAGTLLDGRHFDLSSWRGKVVIVNFWASNCAPCVAEAAALQKVYADNHDKGVEFLGVDVRDDEYQARKFEAANHVTYPSLYDPSNLLALRFHGVPPNATPTTIVLDREGRIAARQSGEILYTQLRDLVARVLKEQA